MRLPQCITESRPLAAATTIGVGGTARYYAAAATVEDLREAVAFAREKGLPLCVLGRGSNVLVADGAVEAVVVTLAGQFRDIGLAAQGAAVAAGAGVALIKLGVALARRGHAGCAYMGVIPGSVGGAVRMNAGTGPGQEISTHLLRARVLDPETLAERWLTPADLAFSYRMSSLSRTRQIVLEALFRLPQAGDTAPGHALADITALFTRRRASQPRSRFTFGSVFKNPAGAEHSAGWYLEQAGMKGERCGTAMVPPEHANWIVNTGGASAADVKALIDQGRSRVFEQFGISLEREVVYLPEDMAV